MLQGQVGASKGRMVLWLVAVLLCMHNFGINMFGADSCIIGKLTFSAFQ